MTPIRASIMPSISVTELEVGMVTNLGKVNSIEELNDRQVVVEFVTYNHRQEKYCNPRDATLYKESSVTVIPDEHKLSWE